MLLLLLCLINLYTESCTAQDQGGLWSPAVAPATSTESTEHRQTEDPEGMLPIAEKPTPVRSCAGSISYNAAANYIFYGNLLGTYKSLGEQACANLCYEHPYCETANFIVENFVCELNSESRSTQFSWHRYKPGVNAIDNVRCVAVSQGICGQANIEPRLSAAGISYAVHPRLTFTLMTEVRPNSFPWLVSIQRDQQHVCSAVLISAFDVVTSASCFSQGANPTAYQAVLGSHSATGFDPGRQTVKVAAIAIHDQYKPSWSREFDLALVRLGSKANIASTSPIRPACLPFSAAVFPEMCVTVGWGRISGVAAVDKLSEIVVPAIARHICNQPDWYNGQVTESMLCAGYGRPMPCQADIGGPLLCQLNGTWSVFGVGSWGEGCARAFKPMVYTSVPYFSNWIRSKITTH